ncbi:MAG TPA: hypothetical protein VK136_08795 [Bacillota bacterium]|nr:hypothetical protein [Bacillota bacterium]
MKKIVWIWIALLVLAGCTGGEKGGDEAEALEGYWTGLIQISDQPLYIEIELEHDDTWEGGQHSRSRY